MVPNPENPTKSRSKKDKLSIRFFLHNRRESVFLLLTDQQTHVPRYQEPSPQELHALAILWNEGPSTVGFVHELINEDGEDRTYTTSLAVMRNLEKKGLAKRNTSGRAHVYEALVDRVTILKPRLQDLVDNSFGGSLGQAILSLISVGVMTPEEKTAVTREIKQHKAMAAKKKTTKKKAAKKAAKKTVKPAAKKKVAKKAARKVAKKAAKKVAKKATKKKVVKKVAKKKVAKKATKKKVVKKAAKKKVAKKAAKKKVAKKAAKKKVAKKAAKKKVAKKAAKKKVAKKAAKKKVAKKKAAKKKK